MRLRVAGDQAAITAFMPFRPVYGAQRELSKLHMYQRVYQNLVVKAGNELPPDLNVRDEVGLTCFRYRVYST